MKGALRARLALFACVVLGLAVTATATAGPTAPTAPAPRTITIGTQQVYNLLPIFAGLRHGFFKKAGISEIKFQVFSSLPPLFAAVQQGQTDLAFHTPPSVLAFNRATTGSKLKFIGAGGTDTLVWLAPNDTTIPVATKANWKSTVLAWKGKSIGVAALGGIVDVFTRYMIKEVGLAAADVKIVPVGVGPPALAALRAGLVDVITGDPLTLALLEAEKEGKNILGFPFGQGPPELLGTLIAGFVTSESTIRDDRATWIAFNEGLRKGQQWILNPKNKRDTIDLMVRKAGVDRAWAETLYRIGVPVLANTTISRKVMGQTVQSYVKTGILTTQPPAYADFVADFAR